MLNLYREGESLEQAPLAQAMEWADLILVGPGIGTGNTAGELVAYLLSNSRLPVVLDADALNLIAREPALLQQASCPTVITPHLGEMARLTGKSIAELKEDLPAAALDFAKRFHTICVLKDARTVVASPEGRVYINTSGCERSCDSGKRRCPRRYSRVSAGTAKPCAPSAAGRPHCGSGSLSPRAAGRTCRQPEKRSLRARRRPDPNPYFRPTVPGAGNFGTPQRLLKPSDGTSRPCRYTSEKKREYLSQTIKIGE